MHNPVLTCTFFQISEPEICSILSKTGWKVSPNMNKLKSEFRATTCGITDVVVTEE